MSRDLTEAATRIFSSGATSPLSEASRAIHSFVEFGVIVYVGRQVHSSVDDVIYPNLCYLSAEHIINKKRKV